MSIPGLSLTVQSKSLGLSKGNGDHLPIILGTCKTGVAKQRYSFTDIKTAKDTLGLGPLTEAVAYYLAVAGGPVLAMPVNPSVPGAAAADSGTHTAGAPTVTVKAGTTPVDAFDVILTITVGGLLGTAQFTYSLDGGKTVSAPILTVTGDYVLSDSGLTITFAAGTGPCVVGDTYKFVCTAPSFAQVDVTDAVTAAIALSDDFSLLHVVGELDTAAHAEALAAAVDALLATAASTQYRYIMGLVECPWDAAVNNDAAFTTAFAAADLENTGVGAGHVTLVSPVNGRQLQRNVAFCMGARSAAIDIQVSPARFADGPLANVQAIDRDEYKSQALDAARAVTARTFPGQAGFYLTNGRLMAVAGSDFSFSPYRRVINKASGITRDTLLQYVNQDLQTNANGTLTEKQAQAIEGAIERAIEAGVVNPGAATGVVATVDRTENVVSTQNITVTIHLGALGYAKTITATIGFQNPATA